MILWVCFNLFTKHFDWDWWRKVWSLKVRVILPHIVHLSKYRHNWKIMDDSLFGMMTTTTSGERCDCKRGSWGLKKGEGGFKATVQSDWQLSLHQSLIDFLGHTSHCAFLSQFFLFPVVMVIAARSDMALPLPLLPPQFCSACWQWMLRLRWRKWWGTTPPYPATISSPHLTLLTSSGCCRSQTPNRKWWVKMSLSVYFLPTFLQPGWSSP